MTKPDAPIVLNVPKAWFLYKPGQKDPFKVTMIPQEMVFYRDKGGYTVKELTDSQNLITSGMIAIAAAATTSNLQQSVKGIADMLVVVYPRATTANPGDTVLFDNALMPLSAHDDMVMDSVGIQPGSVYTVVSVQINTPGQTLDKDLILEGVSVPVKAALFQQLKNKHAH